MATSKKIEKIESTDEELMNKCSSWIEYFNLKYPKASYEPHENAMALTNGSEILAFSLIKKVLSL